jgi:hypothetical protein
MRLAIKVFSVILVLYILSILFVPSVKAGCGFNSYYQCTGTCSCICGGSCYCGVNQWGHCVPLGCNTNCCQYNCRKYSCNSNEDRVSGSCAGTDMVCCKPKPQPTNTPKPTNPPASPTVPPGGCTCQNGKCIGNLTQCRYTVVDCPKTCSDPTKNATIEEYCQTTNTTCSIKPCAGYSASCVSNCKKGAPGCVAITVPADCAYNAPGCNICGYARTEAIYCNGVHCGDTCVPHALCSNSPWCSGSANPTNTPAPIPNPSSVCDPFSPKKKKFLHLRVFVS